MSSTDGLDPEYVRIHLHDADWADPAKVRGADAATYRVLNRAWAVDAQAVFLEGKRLKDVDHESFRVLNELYARDEARIFCTAGSTAAVSSPETFEVLDTAEAYGLAGNHKSYARDRGAVYYAETFTPPRILKGADPASFAPLKEGYARDARNLYFEGKPVRGADPAGFEWLAEHYVRTASGVYQGGRKLPEANPREFRPLDAAGAFWRDDARVYWGRMLVAGADPETFVCVDQGIARDATQIFINGVARPEIDAATFEHLGFDYFRDRKGHYWLGEPMDFFHCKTFVAVDYGRGRDRNGAIYKSGKYASGTEEQRARYPRDSLLKALWSLFSLIGVALFAILLGLVAYPYTWWKRRRQKAMGAAPADNDVRALAEILARGDRRLLDPMLTFIADRAAFDAKYLTRTPVVEEPDFEAMLAERDDPDDVDDFHVFLTVFQHYGVLAVVDWKEDPASVQEHVEPMLHRLGVEDFDWSFVEVLEERAKGNELATHNFLSVLHDRMKARGFGFLHVNLFQDAYGFALVPESDRAAAMALGDSDRFAVSDSFGADKGYQSALRILGKHGTRD